MSYASDVYSYSMVMYALCTDAEPYADMSLMETITHVTNGQRPNTDAKVEFKGDCSMLKPLLKKSWVRQPEARPSIDKMVHELDELLITASKRQHIQSSYTGTAIMSTYTLTHNRSEEAKEIITCLEKAWASQV
jgi:serine/threonine protein kinase